MGPLETLGLALGTYALFKLAEYLYDEITSPFSLRDLPGPPNPSFFYGNFKEMWDGETSTVQEKWIAEYGENIQFKSLFSSSQMFTADLKAINYILSNNYDYQKPESAIYNLRRVLGEGVLLVEADEHKRQRHVMNPAFGPVQVRELTEIFVEKSIQLRDIWAVEAAKQNIDGKGAGKLDALSWLTRASLDIIGLAGFNYKFDALVENSEANELNNAFKVLFESATQLETVLFLRATFPWLRFLKSPKDNESSIARRTMHHIGESLLKESKATIANDPKHNTSRGRDLLSLLVRANTSSNIPASQRLNDKQVLDQIPTFLVAGHDTSSVAVTWAIYALSVHPAIQTKLREELSQISTDNPSMDELNSLAYLDAFVREVLRLYAPIPDTIREAMKDDFVPLSKPFTDRKGKIWNELRIKKGTIISIPLIHINRSKSFWGADATEFKPERWERPPEAIAGIPGIWANLMTFGAGPRACIGYRFTLVEMKALLFTLIRAFTFELDVPAADIVKKSAIVQRPVLCSDNSNQLPVVIRPVDYF